MFQTVWSGNEAKRSLVLALLGNRVVPLSLRVHSAYPLRRRITMFTTKLHLAAVSGV